MLLFEMRNCVLKTRNCEGLCIKNDELCRGRADALRSARWYIPAHHNLINQGSLSDIEADFALKMMNSALKMMNSVLEMTDSVLK